MFYQNQLALPHNEIGGNHKNATQVMHTAHAQCKSTTQYLLCYIVWLISLSIYTFARLEIILDRFILPSFPLTKFSDLKNTKTLF